MQRVTNCIIIDNGHLLLLKKPRRGWYAIPGGKMEQGESIKESVVREYREETALTIHDPELAGAFTFSIYENDSLVHEWMMFTFICKTYEGTLTDYCAEGVLKWIPVEHIHDLPMAEGDRKIFEHVLANKSMLYGSFSYTEDFELLNFRLDSSAS
ncbi:8-oxo-dGTP diphosphatase [Virgibacillus sp. C22-A2]|uniref:8-oxo-dGTP diphosphatase n=1 Tax=Virgibacillus tibetensis TaxID=3042313 RepID=A0ABU6KJ79_9BACI|nr:8-oxo-dGTP diphosphatase [Virgibacillus sp. C22-A2]